MRRLLILVVALVLAPVPACKSGVRGALETVQYATKDARIWWKLDGHFRQNNNLAEWAWIDGEGTYEIGIRWVNPLTGQEIISKVLSGTGKIRTGWHLDWSDEKAKIILETVGYDLAHAAIGDPPKVEPTPAPPA